MYCRAYFVVSAAITSAHDSAILSLSRNVTRVTA
jgi:hypothetical protein